MEMCDPQFKKVKGVVFRESKDLVFGFLRVIGKTTLLRGVGVDESCVGMSLPNLVH